MTTPVPHADHPSPPRGGLLAVWLVAAVACVVLLAVIQLFRGPADDPDPLAIAVEIGLYLSYRGHDARSHYATHLFVGASTALLIMAVVASVRERPVPYPLVWPVLGDLYAMFPDFLFSAGIAHHWWMEVFLGHISTHFVPGRNLTWAVVSSSRSVST